MRPIVPVIHMLTNLSEGNEGGVDSKGELDRELRGNDRGQDEGALQK